MRGGIKVISTQALVEKFQQALQEEWGYIWGTAGILWTAAKQAELEKTTDSERKQGRLYGKKWIGHKVADCSGLFKWAFLQLGGEMYHGSNTMYLKWCSAKGELKKGKRTDSQELKIGTAVFVWNGSTYSHVGLYVGNGLVIEAANTIKGVTASKITENKWSHWGELKGVVYANSPAPVENKYPTLRRGSKGDAVVRAQELLRSKGYSLGSFGVDGSFGPVTEKAVIAFQKANGLTPDGVIGKNTWQALENQDYYTFTASHLTKSQADTLRGLFNTGTINKE